MREEITRALECLDVVENTANRFNLLAEGVLREYDENHRAIVAMRKAFLAQLEAYDQRMMAQYRTQATGGKVQP